MIINSFSKDFEKKLKASDKRVGYFNGINLLALLRRPLKFRYMSKFDREFLSTNHSKRSLSDVVLVMRSILFSALSLRFLLNTSSTKHLFLGFSRRSPRSDGKLLDRFHDPIIDALDPKQCLMIERPFKLTHFNNRATSCRVVDYDIFVYLSLLLSYVILPIVLLRNRSAICEFVSNVNDEFGYTILSSKGVALTYCTFKVESLFSKFFLKLIKPNNLVVTSRWLHYPMLYQARKLGIKSFEVQHGCVMPENFFYSEFNEYQFDVDSMLVFSEYWKESNWNTKNVFAIGVSQEKVIVRAERKKSSVLVISQPETSTKLDKTLYDIATANSELMFEIKLHPQDMANYAKRYSHVLSLNNVSVVGMADTNTENLTTKYQLILGFTSSVLFEAYHLGASVGIICDKDNDASVYEKYYGVAVDCFHFLKVGEKISSIHFEHKDSGMNFYDELNKELITEILK